MPTPAPFLCARPSCAAAGKPVFAGGKPGDYCSKGCKALPPDPVGMIAAGGPVLCARPSCAAAGKPVFAGGKPGDFCSKGCKALPPDPVPVPHPAKLCDVVGCMKPANGTSDACDIPHMMGLKNGTLARKPAAAPAKLCGVVGCMKPVSGTSDACDIPHMVGLKNGTLARKPAAVPVADPTCALTGCFTLPSTWNQLPSTVTFYQVRDGTLECCSVPIGPYLATVRGASPAAKPVLCVGVNPISGVVCGKSFEASNKYCGVCGADRPDPKATCAMKCPNKKCGGDIAENAKFCGLCATERPDPKLTCAVKCPRLGCAETIAENAGFCGQCAMARPIPGYAPPSPPPAPPPAPVCAHCGGPLPVGTAAGVDACSIDCHTALHG